MHAPNAKVCKSAKFSMLKDSLVDSYCCFVITMCWVKFEIHFCLEIGNFSRFVLTPSPLNPSSTNPTTWSNILKQFISNLPTNCLSVFHHFVKLALKGLRYYTPFKVRKFESLFYKINTCLQKTMSCIGLQAQQIFSINL